MAAARAAPIGIRVWWRWGGGRLRAGGEERRVAFVIRRMGGARHIRHQDSDVHRAQLIMGPTTAPCHTCHAISILTTQDTA
ncbi:hypothetical protein G6F45_014293 [Rhizopus arrhizus]|nr:hypothetical protein G6F45_014293 [Rhizopus arrhizus]